MGFRVSGGKINSNLSLVLKQRAFEFASFNLARWNTVSTNTLSGATLNLTNSMGGALSFYRALWAP